MATPSALDVVNRYFDALAAKDFPTGASMFTDDITWHQPGDNRFSGTHNGGAAVGEMLGGMMTVSEGTFALSLTGAPMVNGTLVAVPVHFAAKRDGAAMAQGGIDLLRIDGDRIAEVWLFSSDPESEDGFWGVA